MRPRKMFDAAEEDVFRRRQVRAQGQLLVDQQHLVVTGAQGLVVPLHLAGLRAQFSGQDFEERALAAAVLPDHRQHSARRGRETDVLQGKGRAERKGQAVRAQHYLGSSALTSSESMFVLSTNTAPESILGSGLVPFRCSSILVTPR